MFEDNDMHSVFYKLNYLSEEHDSSGIDLLLFCDYCHWITGNTIDDFLKYQT